MLTMSTKKPLSHATSMLMYWISFVPWTLKNLLRLVCWLLKFSKCILCRTPEDYVKIFV